MNHGNHSSKKSIIIRLRSLSIAGGMAAAYKPWRCICAVNTLDRDTAPKLLFSGEEQY